MSNIYVLQHYTHRRILGIGKLQGHLYKLVLPTSASSLFPTNRDNSSVVCSNVTHDSQLRHSRLGHLFFLFSRKITGLASHVQQCTLLPCDVCHFAKQSRSSFSSSDESHALVPFELLHCDLWGSYKHKTYFTYNSFFTMYMMVRDVHGPFSFPINLKFTLFFVNFLHYISTDFNAPAKKLDPTKAQSSLNMAQTGLLLGEMQSICPQSFATVNNGLKWPYRCK